MFLSLYKYNMRIGYKSYLGLTAILLLSLGVSFISTLMNINFISDFMVGISILVSFAMIILYLVFGITQFYSQVSGAESYLTYMIPTDHRIKLSSKLASFYTWGAFIVGLQVGYWAIYSLFDDTVKGTISSLKEAVLFMESNSNMSLDGIISLLLLSFLGASLLAALAIAVTSLPALRNRGAGIPVGIVGFYICQQCSGLIALGIWVLELTVRGKMVDFNEINDAFALGTMNDLFIIIKLIFVVLGIVSFLLTSSIMKKHHTV